MSESESGWFFGLQEAEPGLGYNVIDGTFVVTFPSPSVKVQGGIRGWWQNCSLVAT